MNIYLFLHHGSTVNIHNTENTIDVLISEPLDVST